MARTTLTAGDRTTVSELRGYRLVQNRPYDCRYRCVCGECNGVTTNYDGTVDRIIYWMDNSIEAIVLCDDGVERSKQVMFPHGDACF